MERLARSSTRRATIIDMIPVRSGHIESVGHENGELHVRFKTGKTWVYGDASNPVSEDIANAIKFSDSAGTALNALVKTQGFPARPAP